MSFELYLVSQLVSRDDTEGGVVDSASAAVPHLDLARGGRHLSQRPCLTDYGRIRMRNEHKPEYSKIETDDRNGN